MKKYKAAVGYILIVLTIAYFIYYGFKHPELWRTLGSLNYTVILLLILLYLIFLVSTALILKYTVEYCRKVIPYKNNLQLSAYSAIINFFGPLQSGPGFRAIYLKNNHKITIKQFFQASVLYYLSFAAISGICIVIGSSYWRWTIVLAPIIVGLAYVLFKWERRRSAHSEKIGINKTVAMKIALATLIQIIIVTVIYYTELQTVNNTISIRQAVAYTGVANLALFVSITPGAIGIREAFLLFSHRLLHIPSKTIVAASVIDRSVYIIFLGILFIFAVTMHLNSKLSSKHL